MNPEIFKQEFNPRHFYKVIRKLGFDKDDAKKATRYYARTTYEAVLQIYEWKYKR